MGTCLWAASSPNVGFGVEHDAESSQVCDGCTLAFGAGLMPGTGYIVIATHSDLHSGVEQRHTTVDGKLLWSHGYCRAVDRQGSRCGGEGQGMANAP